MKKILILTFTAFCMMNCEVKVQPKAVNAQASIHSDNKIVVEDTYIKGMHYKIFRHIGKTQEYYASHDYYWSAGGVTVVNVTKDSLEIALLKNKLGIR